MRRFLTAATLAALIFSTGTGCAPKVTTKKYEPKEGAYIKIINHNWFDANVYLVQGEARYKVGFVPSNSTEIFKMPIGVRFYDTSYSYFYVDFVGGEAYTHDKDFFIIYPNTLVEFYIANFPQYSYVFIIYDEK